MTKNSFIDKQWCVKRQAWGGRDNKMPVAWYQNSGRLETCPLRPRNDTFPLMPTHNWSGIVASVCKLQITSSKIINARVMTQQPQRTFESMYVMVNNALFRINTDINLL